MASVLLIAGSAKVMNPAGAARKAALLRRILGTRLREALIAVGVAEIAVAIFVAIEPWGKTGSTFVFCGLVLSVTGYGLVSLRETGTCGCSGMSEVSSVRGLLARNLGLFGLGFLGLQLGPTFSELDGQPQWVIAIQPVYIWGLVAAAILVRALEHPGSARARRRLLSLRVRP